MRLIGRYWHDAYVQMDDFVNGEARHRQLVAVPGELHRGRRQDFSSVIPKEAHGWADTTMMHTGGAPNCAYLWMEHHPAAGRPGLVVRLRARRAGCRGNELLYLMGVTNGIQNFDQIEFWKTPQSDCFAPDSATPCACQSSSGSRTTLR